MNSKNESYDFSVCVCQVTTAPLCCWSPMQRGNKHKSAFIAFHRSENIAAVDIIFVDVSLFFHFFYHIYLLPSFGARCRSFMRMFHIECNAENTTKKQKPWHSRWQKHCRANYNNEFIRRRRNFVPRIAKAEAKKKKHKMKMWEDWHYRNWFWLATRSDIQYSHMLHWPNIVIALTSTTTSILWLSPSKKKNTNFSADNLVDRIDNSIWCQSYVWRWYFEPINANFEVRIELECNGDTRVGRA